NVAEHLERLLDRHLEDLGDREAFVLHLERLAVVALAAADVARDVDVGQKVHLDLDLPVALARFAAPAFHVEREPPRSITAHARLGCRGHQVADLTEELRVGRGVRARSATNRRMRDAENLLDELEIRTAEALA